MSVCPISTKKESKHESGSWTRDAVGCRWCCSDPKLTMWLNKHQIACTCWISALSQTFSKKSSVSLRKYEKIKWYSLRKHWYIFCFHFGTNWKLHKIFWFLSVRLVSWSCDHSGTIWGQHLAHVITLDQSEASILVKWSHWTNQRPVSRMRTGLSRCDQEPGIQHQELLIHLKDEFQLF